MYRIAALLGLCLLATHATANFDAEFVTAHNSRRETYHEAAGKDYIPLKHSDGLEDRSRKMAQILAFSTPAVGCIMRHCRFLPEAQQEEIGCEYGENLFLRLGGLQPTPEDAVRAWVDNEEADFLSDAATYKNAGHFTQALWRPTEYVGCHTVTNTVAAATCHVTVCSYAKPGNCGDVKGERIFGLYDDDSECEPKCPPEGCF